MKIETKKLLIFLITILLTIKFAFSEVVQIWKWNSFANAVYISDGIFITNKHCDSLFDDFQVIIKFNDKQKLINIKEVYYFNDRDIVIFVVDKNEIKEFKLKEEKYLGIPEKFKKVFIDSWWITRIKTLITSQIEIKDLNTLYMNGAVYQGMSGSAVYFDKYLVGIVAKGNAYGDIYCEIINEQIINTIKQIQNEKDKN
jgi:hypothetical protein